MKRLGICVLGLNFGKHIVDELISSPGNDYFELLGVCDMDRDKADAVAAKAGVKAYYDLQEVLAEDTLPVVGLFTGPAGRAELIETIINAGRDVMTTKPFETDPDAALAVLRRAQELGRVVHLNSPAPAWPADLAQVKQWQQEYDLGRPIAANLNVWVRYQEEPDGRWLDDPELCPVAPVFRLGIYLINDMVRLIGEPEKVQAFGSRIFTGRPTADNGQLGILFRNGAICNIFASFCIEDGDLYRNGMTLSFERGTVYRNIGPQRKYPKGGVAELALVMGSNDGNRDVVAEAEFEQTSGAYQWESLHRAIHGETIPDEVTPEQIAAALRVLQAMAAAERSGTTIVIEDLHNNGNNGS